MKPKTFKGTFRVDTVALLTEIVDCALAKNQGVLKHPINIFKNLLAQVAQRATELNDPILNKLMFDLTLYELPSPGNPEYKKLLDKLYKAAKAQERKEKLNKSK